MISFLNFIPLKTDEFVTKTSKETRIHAGRDLLIKSSKSIKLKASKNIEIKGQKIKLKGSTGVCAEGKQIARADDQSIGLDTYLRESEKSTNLFNAENIPRYVETIVLIERLIIFQEILIILNFCDIIVHNMLVY